MKFWIVIFSLFFVVGCNSQQNNEIKNEKPNVLLIVADDLGYGDLHCYGNKITDTPNLDQLAEDGVKFVNAYASASVCSPTRASLLTGKNPVAVDITDYIPGRQSSGPQPHHKLVSPKFNWQLPLDEITIAEKLKEQGYKTASIGKWHLGGEGSLPTDHGFDLNIAGNRVGMPPSYYYPYTSDEQWRRHKIKPLELTDDSLYLTDRMGNEAIEFIKKQKDSAFFLYLPFYTVHTPVQGRKDLLEKYVQRVKNLPDTTTYYPDYLAMVECMDENVGRIVQTLKELEIENNTVIIFVSDNGGWFSKDRKGKIVLDDVWAAAANNSPLRDGKGTLYEGGLRVPTIIKWPEKIDPNKISDELVISSDIFPTIMDIIDIEIDYPIEGVSLISHIVQDKAFSRETLYWHYPHYHRTRPASAIRDGDFKLIRYYEDNRVELYNLKEDVGEQHDLADEMPEKASELIEKLNNWLKENNAKMLSPNPGYEGENT